MENTLLPAIALGRAARVDSRFGAVDPRRHSHGGRLLSTSANRLCPRTALRTVIRGRMDRSCPTMNDQLSRETSLPSRPHGEACSPSARTFAATRPERLGTRGGLYHNRPTTTKPLRGSRNPRHGRAESGCRSALDAAILTESARSICCSDSFVQAFGPETVHCLGATHAPTKTCECEGCDAQRESPTVGNGGFE